MAKQTIELLQDYDWEMTAAGRYTHRLHKGWEFMLTTNGWAHLDRYGRSKRAGFYRDSEVLAKYLEALNVTEIRRHMAVAA